MSKRENYMNDEYSGRKLDCVHDLSKGEKQYLARKGISGREFDNLTPRQQREWKNEMRNPSYDKNDKDFGSVNAIFKY